MGFELVRMKLEYPIFELPSDPHPVPRPGRERLGLLRIESMEWRVVEKSPLRRPAVAVFPTVPPPIKGALPASGLEGAFHGVSEYSAEGDGGWVAHDEKNNGRKKIPAAASKLR